MEATVRLSATRGRWLAAVAVLLAFSVSGCLDMSPDGGSGGEDQRDDGLLDIGECDLRTSNGSALDCRDRARSVTPGPLDRSEGWICVNRAGDTFRLYRKGTEDRLGIGFNYTADVPRAKALAWVSGHEQVAAFTNWTVRSTDGFVDLGEVPSNGTVYILTYRSDYATSHPVLANGTFDTLWTYHGEDVWPFHVVATPDGRSHFPAALGSDRTPVMPKNRTIHGDQHWIRFAWTSVVGTAAMPYEPAESGGLPTQC